MRRAVTVETLYKESKTKGERLLSDFVAPFWASYLADHERFDRAFYNLYYDFHFMFDADAESPLEDFRSAVESVLALKETAYDELFRLEDIPDDVYDILNNYDLTEIMKKSSAGTGKETKDAHTDTRNLTQTGTQGTEKTSENEYHEKPYTDTRNLTQTGTSSTSTSGGGTETQNAYTDNLTTTHSGTLEKSHTGYDDVLHGEQTTDTTVSTPQKEDVITEKVSAFDKDDFANRAQNTHQYGASTVDTTGTVGEYTDKTTYNDTVTDTHNLEDAQVNRYGEKSVTTESSGKQSLERNLADAETSEYGEQVHTYQGSGNDTVTRDLKDAETSEYGEQVTNTESKGSEEWTLTRKGNIGVMTQSDILQKHFEFWNAYEYYTKIFRDIADYLLLAEVPTAYAGYCDYIDSLPRF